MLKDKIPELLDHITSHANYLDHNETVLDIYEGNLEEYILGDLKKSLSEQYFQTIQTRIIPINILKRLVDKLAKVYALKPIREAVDESIESDVELMQMYEKMLEVNDNGNTADEYAHLFKAYTWEPYLHKGKPKMRTLSFDQFLPYSDDKIDPTYMTVFIKFVGKRMVTVPDKRSKTGTRSDMRDIYFAFSDEEFVAFDSHGDIYDEAMQDIEEFENPVGRIPFHYSNISKSKLIPVQDTDLLRMTKVIPVILSDVSGTILYQCFSVIWGLDVDFEELKMSPNAFWSLKSTSNPGEAPTSPQVGTIKPNADIDKVTEFVLNVFAFWLETKGIKVGAIGSIDGGNMSSGIAKIIDELDVTEIKKIAIERFKKDEKKLWNLIKDMHNYWVESGQIEGFPVFSEDFAVMVDFDDPEPNVSRKEKVETVDFEIKNGYLPPEEGLKQLYPDADQEEIDRRLEYYNEVTTVRVFEDASTEDQD